jgi:hypothetical protein
MHNVWCISITLERALRYCFDLLPNEVKHTKTKSMGARSHNHLEIPVVGRNVRVISFLRSHRPSKKTVQVGIERKKIRSGSHTPSFIARVHESHLA